MYLDMHIYIYTYIYTNAYITEMFIIQGSLRSSYPYLAPPPVGNIPNKTFCPLCQLFMHAPDVYPFT